MIMLLKPLRRVPIHVVHCENDVVDDHGLFERNIENKTVRPKKRPSSFSIEDILRDDEKRKESDCYNQERNYNSQLHHRLQRPVPVYCNRGNSYVDLSWQNSYTRQQFQLQSNKKIQHTTTKTTNTPTTATHDEESNQDDTLDQMPRFDWLECTRYKPPKVARSKRKRGKTIRASRQPRVPFTLYQQSRLEEKFQNDHYLTSIDVVQLSTCLDLPEQKIKIWFQNRRARDRRETQTCIDDVGNSPCEITHT